LNIKDILAVSAGTSIEMNMGVKYFVMTGLLLAFAMFVGFINPAKAAVRCEAVFSRTLSDGEILKQTLNLLGMNHVPGHEMAELSTLVADLRETSPSFRRDYRDQLKGRTELTDQEKFKLLADFQNRFWDSLSDQRVLARMRDRALDRELDTRGAPRFHGIRGRQRLVEISRQNLARIMKEKNLNLDFMRSPKIMRALSEINFDYHRNGGDGNSILGDGILSSRQLEKCCANGGLNSQLSFNRDFLKSDDNIYFFLNMSFGKSADRLQYITSEYGDHGLTVSEAYLQEHGWISPFIMHNSELLEVAKGFSKLNENFSPAERIKGKGSRYAKDPYEATAYETQALAHLHEVDFTVADFKTLVQAQAAKLLMPTALEINDAIAEAGVVRNSITEAYARQVLIERTIKAVKDGRGADLITVVMQQLGLGSSKGMELKVPVFLPKDQISSQW
jgi:hypothetical protein